MGMSLGSSRQDSSTARKRVLLVEEVFKKPYVHSTGSISYMYSQIQLYIYIYKCKSIRIILDISH